MSNPLLFNLKEFEREQKIRSDPLHYWTRGEALKIIILVIIGLPYIEYLRSIVSGI